MAVAQSSLSFRYDNQHGKEADCHVGLWPPRNDMVVVDAASFYNYSLSR